MKRGARLRRLAGGLLGAWLAVCAPARADEAPALTSPALDKDAYAPGMVKTYSEQHEAWVMRCQEVARLHQRFCDLTSTVRGAGVVISMTVTTNDAGKPAALLRLPPGVLSQRALVVSAKGVKKPMRLRIVQCEPSFCSTVWAMTPAQLAGLNEGRDLAVDFAMIDPAWFGQALAPLDQAKSITATISGKGFADAVKASQSPNPHS